MQIIIPILVVISALVFAPSARAQTDQPTAAAPAPAVAGPAPPAVSASQPQQKSTWNNGERCVQHTTKDVSAEIPDDHPNGPALVPASYFMPAGGPFKVAIDEPYNADNRYFGLILPPENQKFFFLEGASINAARIADNDPLVAQNIVEQSAALLTLQVPAAIDSFWRHVTLYVWYCDSVTHRPKYLSKLTIRTSSPVYSALIVWPVVILLYLVVAVALSRANIKNVKWYRYLDPVYMTAGSDGKGSLSKLQILFFSLIVFGLLSYIVVRTGVLSDLSSSVLLLLGITGFGSAAAKGTDEQKNTLSFENRSWLIRKGWLTPQGFAAINDASWHDIITNDNGEFDVYRYQSCIFSLIVGGALLVGGINELASFTIPGTLLGILGLSQAVYIGGKVVTKSPIGELDGAIDDLRGLEKKFVDTSIRTQDPNPAAGGQPLDIAIRRAGKSVYSEYIEKAKDVRGSFASLTGLQISDSQLEPNVAI